MFGLLLSAVAGTCAAVGKAKKSIDNSSDRIIAESLGRKVWHDNYGNAHWTENGRVVVIRENDWGERYAYDTSTGHNYGPVDKDLFMDDAYRKQRRDAQIEGKQYISTTSNKTILYRNVDTGQRAVAVDMKNYPAVRKDTKEPIEGFDITAMFDPYTWKYLGISDLNRSWIKCAPVDERHWLASLRADRRLVSTIDHMNYLVEYIDGFFVRGDLDWLEKREKLGEAKNVYDRMPPNMIPLDYGKNPLERWKLDERKTRAFIRDRDQDKKYINGMGIYCQRILY